MAKKKNSRAASGAGSIRQRPDGLWEARISVGSDPATGKPIRRSIYGKTQREVKTQMTAILKQVDDKAYTPPTKMKMRDWLNQWMETYCKRKVKPLTYSSYEGIIKNHIIPAIGNVQLQQLNGKHIQDLYNTMTDAGLSGKTVKNVSAVLHKALNQAVTLKYIPLNPCIGSELPASVKHEIRPLTDDEIPLFLNEIEDSPMRNAFALCLFAGLREGECLGLSWGQVDFQRGRITISQQLQREKKKGGEYYISSSTKSGKTRTIEPPPIAFQYLKAERNRQLENRFKAAEAWDNPDNLVFTNELGGHLAIITFYRHFKKIAAAIGRPDARPHDLRHSCATVALASGADIKSVQDLLGHATASFTLDVYGHVSDKMKQDTAARMQNYYDSLKKMG